MRALNFSKYFSVFCDLALFLPFMKNLNGGNVHFRAFDPLVLGGNHFLVTQRRIMIFPVGNILCFGHGMSNVQNHRPARLFAQVRCIAGLAITAR